MEEQQVMLVLNHNSNEASVIVQNASAATPANSGRNNLFLCVCSEAALLPLLLPSHLCFLCSFSCLFVVVFWMVAYNEKARLAASILYFYTEPIGQGRDTGYRVVEISGASLAFRLLTVCGFFIAVFWKS